MEETHMTVTEGIDWNNIEAGKRYIYTDTNHSVYDVEVIVKNKFNHTLLLENLENGCTYTPAKYDFIMDEAALYEFD